MKIEESTLKEYNSRRPEHARSLACHAPFTALNFEQGGNVTACCYNRTFVLGKYPENNLNEIWFGEKAKELKKYIEQNDFSHGCELCARQINSHNFEGSRAKGFDTYAEVPKPPTTKQKIQEAFGIKRKVYPKVLEFEIDNTCNLECVMCNGKFSSLIRKNRENLPPIPNPYDDEFVEQIKPFLPHLEEAKFLGGEPFLTPLFYKIWDAIAEINPKIRVYITTNGTVLTQKVKDVLEKLNVNLIISIDAISKDVYESIRINANYEKVMENISFYYNYSKIKGTQFSFSSCPMTNNWFDIPNLLNYANNLDVPLFFNTVLNPKELSFSSLKYRELKKIVEEYESFKFPNEVKNLSKNQNAFKDLINYLKTILEDRAISIEHFKKFKKYLEKPEDDLKELARLYLFAQELVTGEGEFKNEDILNEKLEGLTKDYVEKETIEKSVSQITSLILEYCKTQLNEKQFENAQNVLNGLIHFSTADQKNAISVLFGIMKTEIRYVINGISSIKPEEVSKLIFSEYVSGVYTEF